MNLSNRFINYLDSVISKNRRDFFSIIIRHELFAISWLVFIIVKLRRWLYSYNILKSKKLPCKVISVGNIVVGGSGKTPAVIAIAKKLSRNDNLRVAIVSRGYRSKTKGCAVVSDGNKILLSSIEAGDEPYLIAFSLPNIPVIISKDRFQAGLLAINKWNSQVIILDDGFQYLRLARDIDILTIDSTKPFGYNHLLPRGYLREPLSTIKESDMILLTKVDQCENLEFIYKRIKEIAPSIPIFKSIHKPQSLYLLNTNKDMGLDIIKDKNILAVCGIANPQSFAKTLQSLSPAKIKLISFPDHHKYTSIDIKTIEQKAQDFGAEFIVTTEKDCKKLDTIRSVPVLVLSIKLVIVKR